MSKLNFWAGLLCLVSLLFCEQAWAECLELKNDKFDEKGSTQAFAVRSFCLSEYYGAVFTAPQDLTIQKVRLLVSGDGQQAMTGDTVIKYQLMKGAKVTATPDGTAYQASGFQTKGPHWFEIEETTVVKKGDVFRVVFAHDEIDCSTRTGGEKAVCAEECNWWSATYDSGPASATGNVYFGRMVKCAGITGGFMWRAHGELPAACQPKGNLIVRILAYTGSGKDCKGGGVPTKVCTPGATQACTCAGGKASSQTCAADGLSWGNCVCESTGDTTPIITSITPSSGPTDKEVEVVILGQNFQPGIQLMLGGTALKDVNRQSDSAVKATVPEGMKVGTYELIAKNPDGKQGSRANAYEVKASGGGADPIIEKITPNEGLNDKDVDITIIGKNFVDGAKVRIGSIQANQVRVLGDKSISATVPSGLQPGTFSVFVENPGGGVGTLKDGYKILGKASGGCGCAVGLPIEDDQSGLFFLSLVFFLAFRRRLR